MKLVRLVSILTTASILTACSLWSPSGEHIYSRNVGNVGIGTSNPNSKLTVVDDTTTPIMDYSGISATISSPAESRAVYGAAINPNSSNNFGGYFTSSGESYGVYGEASDDELGIAGGFFDSRGERGRGVMGLATNTGDGVVNYGGWFEARGKQGVGLWAMGGEQGYAAKFDGNVLITKETIGPAFVVQGKREQGQKATELFGGLTVRGGASFYAGFFEVVGGELYAGNEATVLGDLTVHGHLSKGGGGFRIDHPLDPENKYLYHGLVESPDMINVYNGNVQLDGNGEAIVKLPSYFQALNKNFRYQLTPLGNAAPNLHVAEGVSNNAFKIAGGVPGIEVSWQITGVRNDAYAMRHRIIPEVEKEANNRGKYLHPDEWGKREELRIGRRHPLGDGRTESTKTKTEGSLTSR